MKKTTKKEVGSSLVLVGALLLVLLIFLSNDGTRVTGNFYMTDKNPSVNLAGNAVGDNATSNDSNTEKPHGFFILDDPTSKMIAYGIFILIIVVGVIFISLSEWKKDKGGKYLKKKM